MLNTSRLATKKPDGYQPAELTAIKAYQDNLEKGTRFIPLWVKIVVRAGARPWDDDRLEADLSSPSARKIGKQQP